MNKFKITDTKNKTETYIYFNSEKFTLKNGDYFCDQTIESFCKAMIKHGVLECVLQTNNNQLKIEYFY